MIIQDLPPFFNVVASGVASVEVQKGMTINQILLKLGGTFTAANISRIVGKLNGKIFYDISGTNLDLINKYKGHAADGDFLMVDFTEANAKTVGGMYAGGIGTAQGVSSFVLEVHISGATNPTLSGKAIVSEPRPLGPINAMIHHPVSLAAGGKFPITLPHGKDAQMLIERVHFFHEGDMTALEIKKNGLLIYENMLTVEGEYIQKYFGKTPQTNHFVFDPILANDLKRVLDTSTANTLQYYVTTSAAETIDIHVEAVANLGNL